jgi:ABC-type nitrate/sulfonate/bicarbonate transport system permease component
MNVNTDVSGIFAALVLLGLMGAILNTLAQYLRRKVVFWKSEDGIEHG